MEGSKVIKAADSQDALNKFKEWSIQQTSPYEKIFSIKVLPPRFNRDQLYRELGLIKVKGALGGTYWE